MTQVRSLLFVTTLLVLGVAATADGNYTNCFYLCVPECMPACPPATPPAPTLPPIPVTPTRPTIPVTTRPATTQPATTLPATTQPATTRPATTVPATTQPVTTRPATTLPATTQPATTRPATTQPATTRPATTLPATTQPATTRPATTRPATTRPATTLPATQPATTRPATTLPATTQPATTQPATTLPATQPATTRRATTQPATTLPVTTLPATQPATTRPATTRPATQPVTTRPATTRPATTLPATTVPGTAPANVTLPPVPITPGAPTTAPPSNTTGAPGGACAVQYQLQHFNLFCFNDLQMNASDCEGRVAAGRSMSLTDFSVGLGLRGVNTTQDICNPAANASALATSALDVLAYPNALECGGDAILNRGRVLGGFAVISGQQAIEEVSFSEGCSAKQGETNFTFWRDFALEMSRQFNAKLATGTATLNGNALTLAGTQSIVEVFDLFIEDLASIQTVITNISENIASVIINLKSRDNAGRPIDQLVQLPSISYAAFEPLASKLLWNAWQIRNISITGVDFFGTLLAPEARINATNGNMTGFIWCDSFIGNLHINVLETDLFCWPLLGNLSSIPTSIPTSLPTTALPATLPATTLPATLPATQPATTLPATLPVTQPATTLPATLPVTQPATTIPATLPVTQSATTLPATLPVTQPATTLPATLPVTQPATTIPATLPATTLPATLPATQPATTFPATLPATDPATLPPIPVTPGLPTTTPEATTIVPATTAPANATAAPGGACSVQYQLQHFNLFCFNDLQMNASDCEGRVAAGRSLNLTDFSVGLQLRNLNTTQNICNPVANDTAAVTSALDVLAYPNALECGGDANLNRGRVLGGFAVISGQQAIEQVSFSQGCSAKQGETNFTFWRDFALEMSRQFNAKSATGTATLNGNALTLAGNQSFVEVIDLFIEDLASVQTVTANINQNIASVIINLKSRANAAQPIDQLVQFPSISYAAFEPLAGKLLWNAWQIRNITITAAGLFGTLLAPEARINATNGNMNGFIWCDSFIGDLQINVLPVDLFCWPLLGNLSSIPTSQPTTSAAPSDVPNTSVAPSGTTPVATTVDPSGTTPVATTVDPSGTTPVVTTTAPSGTTPVVVRRRFKWF